MNNFSVYIKENGTYNEINAIAVFPFRAETGDGSMSP